MGYPPLLTLVLHVLAPKIIIDHTLLVIGTFVAEFFIGFFATEIGRKAIHGLSYLANKEEKNKAYEEKAQCKSLVATEKRALSHATIQTKAFGPEAPYITSTTSSSRKIIELIYYPGIDATPSKPLIPPSIYAGPTNFFERGLKKAFPQCWTHPSPELPDNSILSF